MVLIIVNCCPKKFSHYKCYLNFVNKKLLTGLILFIDILSCIVEFNVSCVNIAWQIIVYVVRMIVSLGAFANAITFRLFNCFPFHINTNTTFQWEIKFNGFVVATIRNISKCKKEVYWKLTWIKFICLVI